MNALKTDNNNCGLFAKCIQKHLNNGNMGKYQMGTDSWMTDERTVNEPSDD